MNEFQKFSFPESLLTSLGKMKISKPTAIQDEAIPLVMQGCDVLASADTGSGKTLAYLLPVCAQMSNHPQTMGLVITPTRELALQVQETQRTLANGFKSALLIGGASMPGQLQDLRMNPRWIIGTPGRINDHLKRGSLSLKNVRWLVVDETDRMLDMGFGVQLQQIANHLPKERQSLMFSATLPPPIIRLAQTYLKNPKSISVVGQASSVPQITQEIVHVTSMEKYPRLLKELKERTGSVVVFTQTKRNAAALALKLSKEKHHAVALHGNLNQNQRKRVMQGFRDQKHRILVATDIAARGLDVPHVKHVINYNLPRCPEDYIHRIGRTARAGALGFALCLVSPEERSLWAGIKKINGSLFKSLPKA